MIAATGYRDRTVAVMGLGRSGRVAAESLALGGAKVLAWDDAPAGREAAAGIEGVTVTDLVKADWSEIAALVLSPGIPHTHPAPHPVAARAKAAGVPIIGDVELLLRACPDARVIAITGTNGKSTTTALIGHILAAAGVEAAVGGNLGEPALSLAPLGKGGVYVIEFSSYQLELTPSLSADVAILLNITPDHLDRHGGLEGYVAAKHRIFDWPKDDAIAIIGADDPLCRDIAAELSTHKRSIVRISGDGEVRGGVFARGGALIDDRSFRSKPVLALSEAEALPGIHNAQNAAAAFAAVTAVDVDEAVASDAIKSFPGLAHRQERVAEIAGVRFVNDSKATNAEATARAVVCYPAIYWIAGGRAKAGGVSELLPLLGNVRGAFLIGECAEDFATTLSGTFGGAFDGTGIDTLQVRKCGTLDRAVPAAFEAARRDAIAGATVLLSPAAASFDQFPNFEQRGDAFRKLVADLAQAGDGGAA